MPKQITFPTREEVRMLSGVDFLKPLSEEELEKLAQRCPDVYFQPKEIISTPADHDDRFFILKHGRVRIYKIGPKGNEQTVAEMSDGTVLTARRLLETYAQALEPTTIIPMTLEDMERLIDSNPKVGMRVIEALCRHLRTADERLADIALKEVPARLANLILQLLETEGTVTAEGYVIPTPYTHEALGTMIGAKRVAVNRAFRKLRESGAIDVKQRRIYITDIDILGRCAQEERRVQRIKEGSS